MGTTDDDHVDPGSEWPQLPQIRRLVTPLPGPKSQALLDRRAAAVPGGVSLMMPVFAAAAGGGVVVDVDGNSLIDFGSGSR